MKPIVKQSDKKAAFTIIELLTVMSVIIILIGLLVPGLNALKRYAKKVTQKNQFHAIKNQMEAFHAEWDDYPTSKPDGIHFCGATRLGEAMVGKDFLGYDINGDYDPTDLSDRRLYLEVERANAYKLGDVYPGLNPVAEGNEPVLCDVYTNVEDISTGKLIGMPILYYKANPSASGAGIYDFDDNQAVVDLPTPWPPFGAHPVDAGIFSVQIWNEKITSTYRPKNAESYILLSAGHDGEYGTGDDIFNF